MPWLLVYQSNDNKKDIQLMNEPIAPSIDVIIPVYNAPLLTKRCIDSVITYLAQTIRTIYIQDDESGNETREMLDSLPYKQVNIFHSPKNQGFGKSVNEAVTRSDADFVLVLNSDTEVYENFLPLLCKALIMDPKLAVISPAHNNITMHELERYIRQPGNYITTYRFKGHAFLIRRATFITIGGFDLAFGRGYFEDLDLSRRLDQQGWHMGVHPDTYIHHEGGASYGRGQLYQSLMKHNLALYLSRHPGACCNILLISDKYTMADLPIKLTGTMEHVFRQGGSIHWLSSLPLPQLSCLQMHNSPASIMSTLKLMLRGWSRKDKRISEVWILPGTSALLRVLLAVFIRARKLKVKSGKQ